MQSYNKLRIVGLVSGLFYTVTLQFHGVEALVLKWLFFIVAAYFFRKAHFEEKAIHGDSPEEAKKRKRLAYVIVGILFGFLGILFIVSRFLIK